MAITSESSKEPAPSTLVLPVALSNYDVSAYAALRTDAAWWEADASWSSFVGDKAADALNGLVTNDVASMSPGDVLHAAALSPKGKLVTDMYVVRHDTSTFHLGVRSNAQSAWIDLARKYVNPRLCKVLDERTSYRTFVVSGARMTEMIAAIADMPGYRIAIPGENDLPAMMLRVESEHADETCRALEGAGILRGSAALAEVVRVEQGRPAIGVDMDENTIPQEANLDTVGAISFTKGCYTGQETVAHVHFRGHVNRHLRGLTADVAIPTGAHVTDANGKVVGDVRSSALSPRFGAIAMGMIRREITVGSTVSVGGTDGAISADVVELPFHDV